MERLCAAPKPIPRSRTSFDMDGESRNKDSADLRAPATTPVPTPRTRSIDNLLDEPLMNDIPAPLPRPRPVSRRDCPLSGELDGGMSLTSPAGGLAVPPIPTRPAAVKAEGAGQKSASPNTPSSQPGVSHLVPKHPIPVFSQSQINPLDTPISLVHDISDPDPFDTRHIADPFCTRPAAHLQFSESPMNGEPAGKVLSSSVAGSHGPSLFENISSHSNISMDLFEIRSSIPQTSTDPFDTRSVLCHVPSDPFDTSCITSHIPTDLFDASSTGRQISADPFDTSAFHIAIMSTHSDTQEPTRSSSLSDEQDGEGSVTCPDTSPPASPSFTCPNLPPPQLPAISAGPPPPPPRRDLTSSTGISLPPPVPTRRAPGNVPHPNPDVPPVPSRPGPPPVPRR